MTTPTTINYKPLVSVITINYNNAEHLEQTILSVINQPYSHIEYILIDGGSTDNSVEIIKKYAGQLRWWCSEKDNGISAAFNKGLQHCNGTIVGIINSGDWYEQNAVQQAVASLENADAVHGWMQLHNGNSTKLVIGTHEKLVSKMSVAHPTLFIKKQIHDVVGLYDESLLFAMDYDLLVRMQKAGVVIKHLPVVQAHMRGGGRSQVHWFAATKEALTVRNRWLPQRRLQNMTSFFQEVFILAAKKLLGRL